MAHKDAAMLKRKQFLALALRRARPGSGSSREFLMTRTWRSPFMSMGIDLGLHRLRTPFVIVGGVATALYMPQRLTLDLDVLVVAEDAPAFYEELQQAGCTRRGALAIGRAAWQTPGGGPLVVSASREPWARTAVRTPNRSATGEPIIALPYLVLLKLAASRPQDLADLSRMLGGADAATLDAVRSIVARFHEADRDDLESLITLGRLEFEAGQDDRKE